MLPKDVLDSAHQLGDELAWQRDDLHYALEALEDAGLAVIGGEAWIVRRKSECNADEPTSKRDNLDPKNTKHGVVLADSDVWVVYGPVPNRDSNRLSVFNWEIEPRQPDEDWKSFVVRSIADTRAWIAAARVEERVLPHLASFAYYNLGIQENEDETPRRDA